MFLSIGPFGALTGLKDALKLSCLSTLYAMFCTCTRSADSAHARARGGQLHTYKRCGNERIRFGVQVSINGFVLPQPLIFLMASSHLFVNGYVCVAKNIFWCFHRPCNMRANSCKSLREKTCFPNSLLENAGFLLNSLRGSLRAYGAFL